jgi:hypothetical protein
MTDIKDWSKQISGLTSLEERELHDIYSEMLATAHDIGYNVPDDQLVETEDPEVLRAVIAPLHAGLVKFHSGLDKPRVDKAKKTKTKVVPLTKPAKVAKQKVDKVDVSKENEMANATAKKAKVGRPAKKAVAPKRAVKKTAKGNARTPVARAPRNSWGENAKIKVLIDENPVRAGTGRFERVANLMKHDGKLVADFLKKGGRGGTLKYAVEEGWVKVIG